MIVTREWIWLHMPKCAGSATEAALRHLLTGRTDVNLDPVTPGRGPALWHDDLAMRRRRSGPAPGPLPGGRAVLCNLRRLPEWTLSYVHFEAARARDSRALPSRAALVRGALRSHRGDPVTPDGVLGRFAGDVTHWLRCDRLAEDLAEATGLSPSAVEAALGRRNAARHPYPRALDFWFRPRELAALYAANPLWAGLEERLWGDTLRLPDRKGARRHATRAAAGQSGGLPSR